MRPGSEGAERLRQSYSSYFNSGQYQRRYPAPNPTIWRRLLKHLTPAAQVLDYGCGSGRYLLSLRGHVARATGFDINADALSQLRDRSTGWDALQVLGPDPADLTRFAQTQDPPDIVLCLFGVLAHITDPQQRHETLCLLRRILKPGGRLLISVPNIRRRFLAEQRGAVDGLVQYARVIEGRQVPFEYQLFDVARLRRELGAAGFQITRICAESTFSETALLNHHVIRWLDAALTPFCPIRWAYGIYAEATC